MNDRQRAALLEPLSSARDTGPLERRTHRRLRGDDTLLTVILAVDR